MSEQAELHLLKHRVAELEETVEIIDRGMSKKESRLRDEFAMASISGINPGKLYGDEGIQSIATQAYKLADAMMEARGK